MSYSSRVLKIMVIRKVWDWHCNSDIVWWVCWGLLLLIRSVFGHCLCIEYVGGWTKALGL